MMTAVYSHGRDGHPWLGQKVIEMRPIVLTAGINILSIAYDEDWSADKMVDVCANFCVDPNNVPGDLILIGSSRGAYIASEASRQILAKSGKLVAGMFLLSPAVYIREDYYPEQDPKPAANRIEIVHGWHDPIIPVANCIKFARNIGAALHILDDEHRLNVQKHFVADLLASFLERVKSDIIDK